MRTALIAVISYRPLVRIQLGPLALSPHGLGTALGFLAGARFFYVLNHLSDFETPLEWFAVWKGGISLLGGIAGAMIAAYPLWRRRGYRILQVMDAAAPGLALGVVIGRIGDLVIADHLGKPTSFFLGYRCPDPAVVGQTVGSSCPAGVVVHQAALYDFLLTIPLLALLLWSSRRPRPEGVLFATWLVFYGGNRLIEDFARIDKHVLGLTGSQWTAIAMILSGLIVLTRLHRRHDDARPPAAVGRTSNDS